MFRSVQRGLEPRSHDQQIAASHSFFGEARSRLAQELAVHAGDAPEVAIEEFFRDLPAVAEVAKQIADWQPLWAIEITEAGGSWRGQNALPHAIDQLCL